MFFLIPLFVEAAAGAAAEVVSAEAVAAFVAGGVAAGRVHEHLHSGGSESGEAHE